MPTWQTWINLTTACGMWPLRRSLEHFASASPRRQGSVSARGVRILKCQSIADCWQIVSRVLVISLIFCYLIILSSCVTWCLYIQTLSSPLWEPSWTERLQRRQILGGGFLNAKQAIFKVCKVPDENCAVHAALWPWLCAQPCRHFRTACENQNKVSS